MLRSLKPPLAVAILGSWGSGKSFGMHLIEKQITKIRCQKLTQEQTWSEQGDEPNLSAYVGHVYQIKFNAWSYAKSDLWASLMQTIFEQLDRQLSLERQLREVGENDLAGGNVWGVINQMNDSDRRAILKSELSQEVFAELKAKNLDSQTLWGILSEVRQEEQKKLESTENELQKLELDVKIKNQEIDKIEQEFNQEVKNIEATVEKEMSDRATLIVFLSQLKEILKEDFGDSILKDFLESCEIKNQKDVKDNLKFDLHKLSDPQITNIIDTAITLLKSAKTLDLDLDQLLSSDFVKNQTDETIKKAITLLEYIQNFKPTLFKNREKITNFLEEQPSKIVGFIEFIKKNPKKLILFFSLVYLPFIVYFSIVPLVKLWGEISTVLQLWLTSVSSIPAITIGMEIFKRIQTLLVRTRKLFQVGRKKIKQEKENIAKIKDQLVKEKIETIAKGHEETQKKDNQEEINNENITNENSDDDNYPQEVEKFKNKIEEIYANREKAKKELTKQQEQIEKLKAQVERQKQRIGLTAQYPSLLDFVNNRLEDDSYQKRLGLMNQVQNDLKDLSDHLTYIPKHTNPDKLKVLKEYFPRGPARIVLYIDDLDRCPPDRVVQVLEAVQLLLNTDIFVVVLAIDDRYISRALEQTYRGVLKRGGTPSGVDYIEKIIQIPYRMRPISKEVAESYLQSLVDIDEETKQENQNISNSKPVIQKSIVLEQTIEQDESKFLLEDGSKLLLEDEQVSEISYQDNIEEYPVETEEKIPEDDISESTNKKSNSESNNKKIPNSANSDPLVDVQRFTAEEFRWIKECCQHVDLTPRTAKRLINICKIIRIIWTPTENDTTWKEPPTAECKQTLIAFLALAGRYPKEMRKILAEIYLEFEETDENTVTIYKNEWLENLDHQDAFIDMHTQREWKKFKNDFYKMPPETEFVFEKRTFNLAVSFCFVGDIGYDPDDNQNREYR
jgi:predicted KAP-like P-loop ATPase